MIYQQPGGMFGGMYGGNVNSIPGMGWGGYSQYQAPAPTPFPPSAQPKPDYGSRFGAPTFPLRNPPQYPQLPGAGNSVEWQPRGGGYQYQPPQQPQMSDEFRSSDPQTQPFNGAQQQPVWGRTMDAPAPQGGMFSAPGFMVNQRQQAPVTPMQPPPSQSLEQFTATLGNPGAYTSGQIGDMYAKSQQQAAPQSTRMQPQSTNFWGNVGPGGTQNPYPQRPNWTPPQWGQQTYGFDPRSLAGQQVTPDKGWYYGRDAIGRNINNAGDAVPSFGAPADGFQRRRWYMG